jgi:hypothetical protein
MLEDRLAFQRLSTWLVDAKSKNINVTIVSLPGIGLSHYLKVYSQENNQDVSYITDINSLPSLKSQNIIDISFHQSPDIYESIDKVVLASDVNQKFIIVIDDPSWLRSAHKDNCRFLSRVYRTEFFPTHAPEDIKAMSLEINPKLSPAQLKEIVDQSCGLARLIKYLSLNSPLDDNLKIITQPLISVLSKCTDEEITKFGIQLSPLITKLLKEQYSISGYKISINNDYSVTEGDCKFSNILSLPERDILQFIIDNQGKISKDKIAEIKWGSDSYDSYSDQAIRKTVVRLSSKLKKYRIRPISKVEYRLEPR